MKKISQSERVNFEQIFKKYLSRDGTWQCIWPLKGAVSAHKALQGSKRNSVRKERTEEYFNGC